MCTVCSYKFFFNARSPSESFFFLAFPFRSFILQQNLFIFMHTNQQWVMYNIWRGMMWNAFIIHFVVDFSVYKFMGKTQESMRWLVRCNKWQFRIKKQKKKPEKKQIKSSNKFLFAYHSATICTVDSSFR